MSNSVVFEGWYRANRSALEGSELLTEVFIWNLLLADLTWIAGKSFYSAKQFHFVGSFPSLPFRYPFSLSLFLSLSPPPGVRAHTLPHNDVHTQSFLLHYKDILWNYFTIDKEFIFQIWMGEFTVVRRTFMLKPLKWKCCEQTFLWATGNESDCDWVWSLYHFQG